MTLATGHRALARAAAHLILASRAIHLNAEHQPTLNIDRLQISPQTLSRIANLVINTLTPLGYFNVYPVRSCDIMLVQAVHQNLHTPATTQRISLTWEEHDLNGHIGLAIINSLPGYGLLLPPGPQPPTTLTTWSDILAVMDLTLIGTPELRRALRNILRETPPVQTQTAELYAG